MRSPSTPAFSSAWVTRTAEKRGSPAGAGLPNRADERIRTADPFITSEVLYQLSYVGAGSKIP
jgi:hypothetical protein